MTNLSDIKRCRDGDNQYYNVGIQQEQEISGLCLPTGSLFNKSNSEKRILCPNTSEWEYVGVNSELSNCFSDAKCNGKLTRNPFAGILTPNIPGTTIKCRRVAFNGDPLQCCINNKVSGSKIALSDNETCDIKYRDYNNADCQSVLENYCVNDNLGKQECIDFCKRYPNRCKQNVSNYCNNKLDDIYKSGTICNNYYNLNSTIKDTLDNDINTYCNQKGDDINDYNIGDDVCINHCRNNIDKCRNTAIEFCGRLNPYINRNTSDVFNPKVTGYPTNEIDKLCGCLYNKKKYEDFYDLILRKSKLDVDTLKLIKDPNNTFDISCYATKICKSDGDFYSKEFLGEKACPTTQCIQSLNTQIRDSDITQVNLESNCLFNKDESQ